MLNLDLVAQLEEILQSVPSLPESVRAAQRTYWDNQEEFSAWVRANSTPDAENPRALVIADGKGEEYRTREEKCAELNQAYLRVAQPYVIGHQAEQEKQIRALMNEPRRGTMPGAATRTNGRNLFDALATDETAQAHLRSVTDNSNFGFRLDDINPFRLMHGIEEMAPGVAPIRTLVTTSTGWPSPVNRPASPEIVGVAHQMPTIADYIPQVQYDAQFAVWMEQILRTNNADGVAEGALKPESALSYVQRTAKLEKIAHWIPVTKEILKFGGPALRAEIEADMVNMLREKEEEKLLSGTGVSPQIQGFLTSPGIGTYARLAAENNLDALLKGFQSVRFTGRAEPDVVFVNPSNMTAAFLVKSTDGVPLYGNYAEGALQTVFGKPYVQTTNMTLGTALTGAFSMYSQIRRAGFIDIEVGMHSDQFIRNCRTILVEEYLALIVKRASAFVTVTNLQ